MEKLNIEIFIQLKSCCNRLIENPSKEYASKVAKVVSDIPNEIVQDLSYYCLFPIVTLLQNNKVSITVREELVRTMRVILEKIRITNLKQFFQIYGSLLIQIYDKSQTNQVIIAHEELKEEVCLCIKYLVHQSYTDLIEQLYTKENILKLGQAILFCLTMARTEKSSTVRLAAIDAIMALCQIDDQIDKLDVVMQEQVADTVMAFLPGIVSGLQEIAIGGSDIQNHKITMMALRAWGRVISLVMCDKVEEKEDSVLSVEAFVKKCRNLPTDTLHTLNNEKCDIKHNLQGATRNNEWFKAVAVKLGICIDMLGKVKSHSHHKVRRELVESIGLILKTCPRNMKPNVTTLIDHLISLSEDESAEVRETASNVLRIVNENLLQNYDMRSLIDSLEDKFYDFLTRFPTLIRRSDDSEQLAFLNQFAGYLRLLGKQRLPHIMRSQAHTRRLLLAIVYVMTIDSSNVSLLQTTNVKDLDDPAYFYGSDSWRQFKFIRNSLCKEKLVATCKLLGQLGDFRILVDIILELLLDASQHTKELILLLNWIFDSDEDKSVSYLYKEIVDYYITEEVWYSPIEVTENTSLTQAQSNIVKCCLLTEGLGRIAEILQCDYDRYLLKTLYLILERTGSGNGLISYIGVRTLENIAKAQRYKTIGDLLRANIDYFSYHIVMKLRRIRDNPNVLDVVRVVIMYSKLDFLPYLKGIVEDVLNQLSVIPCQQKDTYSFLRIFHTFVVCIKMLARPEDTKATKKEDVTANNPSEAIVHSLLEFYAKKTREKMENDYEDTETNADVSNIEISEEETKKETEGDFFIPDAEDTKDKKLPTQVKIIVEILKSCLNFVPLKDVQKSLLAMGTLQEGLPMLIEWEDELLPLVHQLWHPLVDRFKDENVLVIHRAWQLLHVLADVSNDFIRSRTLKQVWPPISKFLKESSKKSLNKRSTDVYKFTQTYKLQYELLSTLGVIARLLKLYERDLWEILNITHFYLNARQNVKLQACCVKLYKDIADYHGDIVWVKCLSIWSSKVAPIPTDITFDIKTLLNTNVQSNEYCRNVKEIIKYIQEKDSHC
ncbi:TELO2-interacting protein 1 homolog isoform X2 [Pseudomyrmex gracilis]|uniref:TELO2-interacting protein 1 homolog isoform X2 n=1 Tax=Pseudomyrmex gracilis TaxID=219809 RepID=UPI00099512C0|nr:TELO2-interacting protein 1 homolog isoform X2 [Pseudomyrmex gracilis]